MSFEIDDLIRSPAGSAFLGLVEQHLCDGLALGDAHTAVPLVVSHSRVETASWRVRSGALLDTKAWLVEALALVNDPGDSSYRAYWLSSAEERRPLAVALAVANAFESWEHPVSNEQWIWSRGHLPSARDVWGAIGRLPLWNTIAPRYEFITTSPLMPEWEDYTTLLEDAWDLGVASAGVARHLLSIASGSRVLEIRGRRDLARALYSHGRTTTSHYERSGLLLAEENDPRPLRTLDWSAMQSSWDAVHFTWSAVATLSYTVVDLDGGHDYTSVFGLGSEATIWLNPVLEGELVPHPIEVARYPDALRPEAADEWRHIGRELGALLGDHAGNP